MRLAAEALGLPADLGITGLTLDSRKVHPGDVFVAIPGASADGRGFIDDALARGAAAVLAEAPLDPLPVSNRPIVVRSDLSAALSGLAGRAYGNPSAALKIAAVTGTNGKTSVAWLVAQASAACGQPCATLGTLGAGVPGGRLAATGLTTADPITVQRLLAQFRCEGLGAAVLEASSHALDQHRIDGVQVDIAAFTNLTRDHLDYHRTMADYGRAKARLFEFPGVTGRVINVDDEFGRQLAGRSWPGMITVGLVNPAAQLRAELRSGPDGLSLLVSMGSQRRQLTSSLLGRFNASNLLVSLGVLVAMGIAFEEAVDGLAASVAAPGRMERLSVAGRQLVVVDYAHTPDALQEALQTLRDSRPLGRLVCVFGCGGDRDQGKRAPMGAIASAGADLVIVTDDNPRTESPAAIIDQILAGTNGTTPVLVERDRSAAIELALDQLEPEDALLIAGKGHEREQIVGTEVLPFSDAGVARAAMARRGWLA